LPFILILSILPLLGQSCFRSAVDGSQTDEVAQLEQEKAQLEREKAALQRKIDRLETDEIESSPLEVEEVAIEGEEEAIAEEIDAKINLNARGNEILRDFQVEVGEQDITVFLVGLADEYISNQGVFRIGCEDVLVPKKLSLEEKSQSDLAEAIVMLLTTKRDVYKTENLTNHVFGIGFLLENIRWEGNTRIIELSGSPALKGVCDDARVKTQMEECCLKKELFLLMVLK